jgi:hypothetical protein
LFLIVCYKAIWREPKNMKLKSVIDILSKKTPQRPI